jgi:hypothetical protein
MMKQALGADGTRSKRRLPGIEDPRELETASIKEMCVKASDPVVTHEISSAALPVLTRESPKTSERVMTSDGTSALSYHSDNRNQS